MCLMAKRSLSLWLASFILFVSALCMAGDVTGLIDARTSNDFRSALGTEWRLVTDGVMGGVSRGRLSTDVKEGRPCLRLSGEVSIENNGGFIQAALPLAEDGVYDASAFDGLEVAIYGNDEPYNLHLRTSDLWLPWQAYRQSFPAERQWRTVRLAFRDFTPYRTGAGLDTAKLERIGIVAIGRAFDADLCIGRVGFYRDGE